MDEIVRQAMLKWPHVPACTGWLGLDARGNWYLRDAQAQALGAFQSATPGAKGALLRHDALIAFIERNYQADAHGCWYFQNGPQRVFVELQATPLVARLHPEAGALRVQTHHGQDVQVLSTWLDDAGRLYLLTPPGLALVHTQDMALAASQVEQGHWQPLEVRAQELPQRFGYVQSPFAHLKDAPR